MEDPQKSTIDWFEKLDDTTRIRLNLAFGNEGVPDRETKFYDWLNRLESITLFVIKKHPMFVEPLVEKHVLTEHDEGAEEFDSFEKYVHDWKTEEINESKQKFRSVMILTESATMALMLLLRKKLEK